MEVEIFADQNRDDSLAFSDCNSDRSGEFPTTSSKSRRLLIACATDNSDELIRQLVSDLESSSIDEQKQAAMDIRLLAKNKPENRLKIARAGAIKPLVSLISSSEPQLQEYGVTAILNLSLCDANKALIASSGAIKPLVRALKLGTSTAKENAACALLRLSQVEENKVAIGRSGAIPLLVNLLENGGFGGKKDASTALYSLCSVKENKIRAVEAGIMKPLVELMADFGSNMVDKSAYVMSILVSVTEARTALVDEGGIPVLVEIIEVGSQRQKEIAVAILLQICEDSVAYRTMVSLEGAIPPLVALSQTGTSRAKEKAETLIEFLRQPRSGNIAAKTTDVSDSFKAVTTTSFDGEDDEPTEKLESIKRLAKKGSVGSRFLTFPTSEMKTLEKDGLGLTDAPDTEEWHDADRVLLMNNEFSKLPEELICPKLIILSLRKNYKLRKISSSFFINMPLLEHLDMSETGIMSLPKSMFELTRLKRLFLQDCQFLMMLPPEVGNLKCLEVLDSEGTEIIYLPVEIKELAALRCLRVSLYGCVDNEWKSRQTNGMIPFGVISALSQLRDVTIGVNPDDERWNACVEGIMNEFGGLTSLRVLRFYFPRVKLLRDLKWNDESMIYSSLEAFRFIVGGHSKRVISRLPSNVDFELEKWKWRKCLKYINGEGVPEDIKKVLKHATAFQLDRHMTVKKLTEFGIENMENLKGCVLGECNEIQVIIDGNDIHNGQTIYESSVARRIGLESLEFLYIYYMKNLKSIWEGPTHKRCLYHLKSLTLSTCPQLTTIFTVALLESLRNLEELTVRDCPAIKSLVSCEEGVKQSASYLPKLRNISLYYVPELVSISSEVRIAPKLERLSLYNCPKLKSLSIREMSSKHLTKITGETDWWEALELTQVQRDKFDGIFVSINADTLDNGPIANNRESAGKPKDSLSEAQLQQSVDLDEKELDEKEQRFIEKLQDGLRLKAEPESSKQPKAIPRPDKGEESVWFGIN